MRLKQLRLRKNLMVTVKDINSFDLSLPLRDPAGIGLRAPYYRQILEQKPDIGWMEVHPENYFGGGVHRHFLKQIRAQYPISFHAVGLSLGSDQPVKVEHLKQIKELIDIFEPFQVSDHASWSASGNAHLNDLLPLPYTQESLAALCENIQRTQDYFGRKILVENPSTYVSFKNNEMHEYEFMNETAQRTGCGILLDINNIYVQAFNHRYDAYAYIDGICPDHVGEMHLAGHIEKDAGGSPVLVDTHNRAARAEVWDLYAYAVRRFGTVPTLIEWDQDFPPLSVLLEEVDRARGILYRPRAEELHAAE